MADLYASYTDLAAHEVEGVDYTRTTTTVAGASWCSIAIHGGGIERGSGEMARQVAGTWMSWYEFAGIKAANNTDLHVTSANFDEPNCNALVSASSRCLSFHGFAGTTGVAETAVGGLDSELVARVTATLQAAGFAVTTAPSEIAGTDPLNICNKTTRSAGVQLEMSRALRDSFFPGGATASGVAAGRTDAFYRYATAVQSAYIGYGRISLSSVNVSRWALLPLSILDGTISATVATDKVAAGGSQYVALAGRWADASNTYLARLDLAVGGAITLTIRKRVAGTETQLATVATGLTHTAGGRVAWALNLAGSTLRARAWTAGGTVPDWQVTATDTALTAAGQMGVRGILSSANTNVLPVVATVGDVRVDGPYQTVALSARAVNGITAAWPAGTPIDVATPAVVAM